MERETLPTTFQKVILWRALTGIAFLTIAALTIAFICFTSKILDFLQPVLIPLAVAGIVAYLLDPIVAWVQRKGMNRLLAVASVFGAFLIAVGIFLAIIIPPISDQIGDACDNREEVGKKINHQLEEIQGSKLGKVIAGYLLEPVTNIPDPSEVVLVDGVTTPVKTDFSDTRIGNLIAENGNNIFQSVTSFLSERSGKIMSYAGLAIGLIMIPIYLYYFLIESSSIKENWHLYVPLKASHFKSELIDTLKEINGYLIAFFRGQVLVAFIDGLLVGIALQVFGLPYGLVIGVLMAFLGVIPFVGNVICLIPACIIAFTHFSFKISDFLIEKARLEATEASPEAIENLLDQANLFLGDSPWAYVGAVIAIFFVVQQINSLFTAPKIVGDSVGLHPMTVIFSMLFWALILGGFIGALLAVPLTAAIKVVFRRYIWERKLMENQLDCNEDPEPSDLVENTQSV